MLSYPAAFAAGRNVRRAKVSTPDPVDDATGKAANDSLARALRDGVSMAEPIATSVAGAVKLCDRAVGRSYLYEAMARGDLPSKKAGTRRVILIADLREWLHNLPSPTSRRAA
jgi:hypothetical protein